MRDIAADADRLRALHVPGTPVVLPNAWDASSAKTIAAAGFDAIATSSSAVAWALGREDGENLGTGEMFAAVRRIAEAVEVPVTADIESGYGLDPEGIVAHLIEAGAAGCNLEDSDPRTGELVDRERQAAKIASVRSACAATKVPLVINARVDVQLQEAGEREHPFADSVTRANAYREAGADCVYPIGIKDPAEMERFVRATDAPVNIAFRPRGPSLGELASIGVARVSFGGGLHLAMQAWLTSVAETIRGGGNPYL